MSNACHTCKLECASLATTSVQLLFNSMTSRISNMAEAINVLSFNVNFPLQFSNAKMHSQKSLSCFIYDASVPIPNEHTISLDIFGNDWADQCITTCYYPQHIRNYCLLTECRSMYYYMLLSSAH